MIPGFRIKEILYQSNRTTVYRAFDEADKTSVIIKKINNSGNVSALRKEFEHNKKLDDFRFINKTVKLYAQDDSIALIMEDIDAISLNKYLKKTQISIIQALNLSIKIATAIDAIHKGHIIHKDINPSNIIYNPNTEACKLIDFGLSTRMSRENINMVHPGQLEGTLAYISPEQTGRMNRSIDYRTDFYSLGITMYELLTGELPFTNDDPLELVHLHIAKLPQKPTRVNPQIPETVSDIVMKLLEKNAENRYQNIYGIIADVKECIQQLEETGTVTSFDIAQNDISDRLQIPEKLYGRDKELFILKNAFANACKNYKDVVFISGFAGIGKTALINELFKPITEKKAFFLAGKYDQLQRATPYSAVSKALNGLIDQLLALPSTQSDVWKKEILNVIGQNGAILTKVISKLELLIGKQPPVEDMPPLEAQNRFNAVFKKFIRVFAKPDHPLVLFVDDLQWIDSASLNAIKELIIDKQLSSFLFIGAFRHNEVDTDHPLVHTQKEIANTGIDWQEIKLDNLKPADIDNMLSHTLSCNTDEVSDLTALVIEKTEGNPFFVKEFIKTIYSKNLLRFDTVWQWDIEKIKKANITDNVVSLMVEKLSSFSAKCRTLIDLASCIGVEFSIRLLSEITQSSEQEIKNDLDQAVSTGAIINSGAKFRFAHDKVQEAAYSMVDSKNRKELHYKIGKALFPETQNTHPETDLLFFATNQWNKTTDLLSDEEISHLINLNIQVGTIARSSTAYEAASQYFKTASVLLGPDAWKTDYNRILQVYTKWGDAEFCAANYEKANELFNEVKTHAKTVLDKINVYSLEIDYLCGVGKFKESLDTVFTTLDKLGVNFPDPIDAASIELGVAEINERLAGKNIESILDLPEMTDPEKQAAMEIMMKSIAPAYLTDPVILTIIILKMVSFSLKHGNSCDSCYGYGIYPVLLYTMLNDPDSAYRFGSMAMQLVERFDSKIMQGRTIYLYGAVASHLKHHINQSYRFLLKGGEICFETGDLQYYGYALSMYSYVSVLSGRPLAELDTDVFDKYRESLYMTRLDQVTSQIFFWNQVTENLQGKNTETTKVYGKHSKVEDHVQELIANSDINSMCHYTIGKMYLSYFFEDFETGLSIAQSNIAYTAGLVGQYGPEAFYFYYTMLMLAQYGKTDGKKQESLYKEISANKERFENLAHHAPANYRHKADLISAELGRIDEKHIEENLHLYDSAIMGAKENGFIHEEAIGNELAGKYLLKFNLKKLAKTYLSEAYERYLKWGCKAKADALLAQYSDLITNLAHEDFKHIGNTISITTPTVSLLQNGSHSFIDVGTILKANQVISGETDIEKLARTIVSLGAENAGANRGLLILNKKDLGFFVVSESDIDRKTNLAEAPIPLHVYKNAPLSIVQYVINTKKPIVLGNACKNEMYMHDIYVTEQQLKSVICMPIEYHGDLSGVFYMENNLLADAFRPERVEMLKAIASQAAISIENALLIEKLKAQNDAILAQNEEYEVLNEELTRTNIDLSEAKEKAEESDRLKTEFFHNMSHEIRTPLNGILGFTSFLRDPDTSPEQKNSYINIIQESGDQLLRIIEDILEI